MIKALHNFTILLILLGLLIGYGKADYGTNPHPVLGSIFYYWSKCYHIWSKTVDVFLIFCVLYPCREYRKIWISLAIFYGIRAIWEFWAIPDYASASHPSIIFSLFLIEICVVCYIMFHQLVKRSKWRLQK